MAELVVRSGGEERLFRLEEDSVVIGRAPGCAIEIDDIHSSRRHAQVIRVRGGFEVVDLKSRNGSLINGAKLDRKLLRHGDVVKIGEVEIQYEDPDSADDGGIVLEDVGGAAPSPAGDVSSLQFRGGDRDGETVPLSADRTTIGRKSSNAIVIPEVMTSSYHCEITRESGGYIIRDLGSTNGTLVNGEMITEMALNHGARIRIGGTRFVFIDPSMAAFGDSFEDVEDAGDWGMMREIDASAVPKRGLKLVPILFLVVLAVGAGAFVWFTADKQAGSGTDVQSPEGNLLSPEIYSFEADEAASSLLAPSGAGLTRVGGGKSGRQALRLTRGDREGLVTARFSGGVEINVESKYRLDGWVKVGEGASATLRIAWRLRGGVRTPWLSTAPPVSGAGGFRKTSITASPPRGATELMAQLVLCEGDAASFDDVTVSDAGALDAPVRVRAGGFDLVVDDAGGFGIARDGDWVLMSGSFVARLEDGTVLDGNCGIEGLEVAPDGAGAIVKGALPGLTGESTPFEAKFSAANDTILIAVTAAGAARVGVTLLSGRDLLMEPMYLIGPEVREARLGAFVRTEKLSRVTFGAGSKRLGGAPAGGGADLGAALEAAGNDLRLVLDASTGEGGAAGLEIHTSFDAQMGKALELAREARRLESQGSAGEANRVCQEIIVGYSFCEAEVKLAEEIAKRMNEKGRLEQERARRFLEAGSQFSDPHLLRQAEHMYAALAADWKSTARGTEAEERLVEVREKLAGARLEEARKAAQGELARGRDLKAAGMKSLAAAVFRSIVQRFGDLPDVEAAVQARQDLAELQGE